MTNSELGNTTQPKLIIVAFLFMSLLFSIVLAQIIFTYLQFQHEQNILNQQFSSQQIVFRKAQTIRSQLESIAGSTATLAQQGNVNAILIRDQLKKQGITIKAP